MHFRIRLEIFLPHKNICSPYKNIFDPHKNIFEPQYNSKAVQSFSQPYFLAKCLYKESLCSTEESGFFLLLFSYLLHKSVSKTTSWYPRWCTASRLFGAPFLIMSSTQGNHYVDDADADDASQGGGDLPLLPAKHHHYHHYDNHHHYHHYDNHHYHYHYHNYHHYHYHHYNHNQGWGDVPCLPAEHNRRRFHRPKPGRQVLTKIAFFIIIDKRGRCTLVSGNMIDLDNKSSWLSK